MRAMMAIPPQHKERISKFTAFLLGGILMALVSSIVGYYFIVNSNSRMVLQQQQLSEVQGFDSTGGNLDNAVRQFSDAVATNRQVEDARNNLRAAIATHSSNAFAIQNRIGPTDYGLYAQKLAEMRGLVDRASTPREGVRVWQAAVDLIAQRRRITERLRQRIES